jgi:hypothetical protein
MNHYESHLTLYFPVGNTAIVVGALLDVGCNEDYIKNLIMSVRSMCPVEPLVEQVCYLYYMITI